MHISPVLDPTKPAVSYSCRKISVFKYRQRMVWHGIRLSLLFLTWQSQWHIFPLTLNPIPYLDCQWSQSQRGMCNIGEGGICWKPQTLQQRVLHSDELVERPVVGTKEASNVKQVQSSWEGPAQKIYRNWSWASKLLENAFHFPCQNSLHAWGSMSGERYMRRGVIP